MPSTSGRRDSNNIYSSSKKDSKEVSKSRRRKRIINAVVIVFSIIFALSGGFMIYAESVLKGMYNPLKDASMHLDALFPSSQASDASDNSNLPDVSITGNLVKDPLVLNIALFGSDVRPNESDYGNSDTMLLLSIDNRHKKVKITSFMRDTWINIPEAGYNAKLNAAYAVGGPKLAMSTLERNFGINIDRYALVDFQTFPAIIDTLGGIDMNITEEEAAYLNHDFPNRKPKFREAGAYHLNGQEALDHSRNRSVGQYDFQRTQRQRDVLMTLVNKFKTTRDVGTITKLMTQILPSITTNITVKEMTGLAQNSLKYLNYPLSQFRLPTDGNFRNEDDYTWGAILVIEDMNKAREDVARFIYEETVNRIYGDTSSEVPIINSDSASTSQ